MNVVFRAVVIAGVLACASIVAAADAPTTKPHSVELQVAALNTLNELNLDADQLKSIRDLIKTTSDDPTGEPAAKGSEAYHAALTSLRDALIADDAQKSADAGAKVDQLRADEHLDIITAMPLTDAARAKSGDALKLLRANQIAGYLSEHGDDVPDAVETIVDAMDQSRGASDADFAAIRDEAVAQVAALVAGIGESQESATIQKQVTTLLEHAHSLKDRQYDANSGKLQKQAHHIVGDPDAFTELHNWMQREMADLLANPELPDMIDARLAHAPSQG